MSLSLREELRALTREAHVEVDSLLSRFDLAHPAGYRAFLRVHAAVLPACEAQLAASGAADLVPDWPQRVRSPALAADLADIGGAPLPAVEPGPRLDAAAALGVMYVLEGSRLGGAVLARRVDANPDAACRGATRYLRHGAGQRLWPTFVATLDAPGAVQYRTVDVTSSALAIFKLFADAARSLDDPG